MALRAVEIVGAPGFVDHFRATVVDGMEKVQSVDGRGDLAVVSTEAGELLVVPSDTLRMRISERFAEERYTMRSTPTRRGDVVRSWSRRINGRLFDFSRIEWSCGEVTVRVYVGDTTEVVHEWNQGH